MIITHSECLSIALSIQHLKRMLRNATRGLSGSTIFFTHYLINCKIFGDKLLDIKSIFIFSTNFISYSKKNSAKLHKEVLGLHV